MATVCGLAEVVFTKDAISCSGGQITPILVSNSQILNVTIEVSMVTSSERFFEKLTQCYHSTCCSPIIGWRHANSLLKGAGTQQCCWYYRCSRVHL